MAAVDTRVEDRDCDAAALVTSVLGGREPDHGSAVREIGRNRIVGNDFFLALLMQGLMRFSRFIAWRSIL